VWDWRYFGVPGKPVLPVSSAGGVKGFTVLICLFKSYKINFGRFGPWAVMGVIK